jgi:ribosomal protein S19
MKRAKWKGPFVKKTELNNKKLLVLPRNFEITLNVVGTVCNVHSGKNLVKLTLVEDMIGHKLGEFVSTRERFVFKKKKKK